MSRRFQQVDVFSSEPFRGNPVAVVLDGDGLTPEEMQRFTRWMNLSETTFLLPPSTPEADYRVKIYTLSGELPFAGHPTLGSCHAWLRAGGIARDSDGVVQECGVGLVRIRREPVLAFEAPPIIRGGAIDEDHLGVVAGVLGTARSTIVDAAWVDNGPGWLGILLPDAGAVLALEPDFSRYTAEGQIAIGVVAPHAPGAEVDFEVRAFFSGHGGQVIEDPVTGSLNASLGQWLIGSGHADGGYTAAQGTVLGRRGRVRVEQDADGGIWVGGETRTYLAGELEF